MTSVWRQEHTFRLRGDDLLSKIGGGVSQTIAADFWEFTGGGGSYVLECGAGTFALTGQTAGLFYGRVLTAGAGSFALSGQSVGLLHGRILSLAAGTFSLSGQTIGLLMGHLLPAGTGIFMLTGQEMGLLLGRLLSLEAGDFLLAGQSIDFIYTQASPPAATEMVPGLIWPASNIHRRIRRNHPAWDGRFPLPADRFKKVFGPQPRRMK